ncbi:DMT family transporter [Chelativorans sp. J32]|uniref:DMT family transporter n=1 Tax=Chelativorans sp. J32 TaxID=935840 RepID=UPI0004809D3D|nr:DMT family transporter [Chelativorans sp. J32]
MSTGEGASNRIAVAWLLTDMALISAMSALVKIEGATYPAVQLVFIRSLIGLVTILPLALCYRREILGTRRLGRHLFRVGCNAMALTSNFIALTALPLAFVTAVGFTRPFVVMIFAVLLLGETVKAIRWIGTAVGFIGVLIMVAPGSVVMNAGLIALFASILFGSLASVQIRALKDENTGVLMVFYSVGLSVVTALPAGLSWKPVASADWPTLLAIGILAQIGQYCYLRAYQSAPANFLAPLSYLSLVFATATGYFIFDEIPQWSTILGVAIILVSLHLTNRLERRL